MAYFKDFSFIKYDYTIPQDVKPIIDVVVDLTQRIQLNISEEDLAKLCDEYIVSDNITPESIAARVYNNPFLHWTILYVNNITDLSAGWPMSGNLLRDFITKKYGAGNEYATHHYETLEGVWIDPDFAIEIYGIAPKNITNYDFEYNINESKRHIKIIKPSYIARFVQSFQEASVNG